MERLSDIATVRTEINTPRLTLQQAFVDYEDTIKKALWKQMDDMVNSGALVQAAMVEFNKSLPKFIESAVRSALWDSGIQSALTSLFLSAMKKAAENDNPRRSHKEKGKGNT